MDMTTHKGDSIPERVYLHRLKDGQRAVLVDNDTGHTMYFYAVGDQEIGVPCGVHLVTENYAKSSDLYRKEDCRGVYSTA